MNAALSPSPRIPRIRRFLLAIGMLTSSFAATAQAEWYVGAYGGLSYPGPFSNVTLSDPVLGGGISGARVNDLELKSTLAGGVKAGYFFGRWPWLGVETDVFTLKPDVVIDAYPKGAAKPEHRWILGKLAYTSSDQNAIKLWTPKGEQDFAVKRNRSKSGALRKAPRSLSS